MASRSGRYLLSAALGDSRANMQLEEMRLEREQLKRRALSDALSQLTGGVIGGIDAFQRGSERLQEQELRAADRAADQEHRSFQRELASKEAERAAESFQLKKQDREQELQDLAKKQALEHLGVTDANLQVEIQDALAGKVAPDAQVNEGPQLHPDMAAERVMVDKMKRELETQGMSGVVPESQLKAMAKERLAQERLSRARAAQLAQKDKLDSEYKQSQIEKNKADAEKKRTAKGSGTGKKPLLTQRDLLGVAKSELAAANTDARSLQNDIDFLNNRRKDPMLTDAGRKAIDDEMNQKKIALNNAQKEAAEKRNLVGRISRGENPYRHELESQELSEQEKRKAQQKEQLAEKVTEQELARQDAARKPFMDAVKKEIELMPIETAKQIINSLKPAERAEFESVVSGLMANGLGKADASRMAAKVLQEKLMSQGM